MRSRATLLAELEEKSLKNKEIFANARESQDAAAPVDDGYDPYDNPGVHKAVPDDAAFTRRRRAGSKRGDRS